MSRCAAGPACFPACCGYIVASSSRSCTELLERAVEVSGERTKKAAVTEALQEFIARREQKRVAELLGTLEWDPAFDHKAERSRG